MRKKEILIVAGILLLAVVSLAAYRLLGRGKTATGKINVYVNGALYASEPLRPGQTLTVAEYLAMDEAARAAITIKYIKMVAKVVELYSIG